MAREETDEEFDKYYDLSVRIIYDHFEVYLRDHPAKHTILGGAAEDVLDVFLDLLRGEND